jgi:hypothetical protein
MVTGIDASGKNGNDSTWSVSGAVITGAIIERELFG